MKRDYNKWSVRVEFTQNCLFTFDDPRRSVWYTDWSQQIPTKWKWVREWVYLEVTIT